MRKNEDFLHPFGLDLLLTPGGELFLLNIDYKPSVDLAFSMVVREQNWLFGELLDHPEGGETPDLLDLKLTFADKWLTYQCLRKFMPPSLLVSEPQTEWIRPWCMSLFCNIIICKDRNHPALVTPWLFKTRDLIDEMAIWKKNQFLQQFITSRHVFCPATNELHVGIIRIIVFVSKIAGKFKAIHTTPYWKLASLPLSDWPDYRAVICQADGIKQPCTEKEKNTVYTFAEKVIFHIFPTIFDISSNIDVEIY